TGGVCWPVHPLHTTIQTSWIRPGCCKGSARRLADQGSARVETMRAFAILRRHSSACARDVLRGATRFAGDAIKGSFVVGVCFVAATTLIAILQGQPAIAQLNPCVPGQSCFTNVSDILNGQRHLLRTDDLLIAGQFGGVFAGARLDTSNSTVTASAASSLTGDNVCTFGSFRTAASARMFNLNHDVTMSVACAGGPSATLSLYFDPDPDLPKGILLDTLFGSVFGRFQLFSTAADFTGDGYDDVVLVGQTANTETLIPS